MQVARLADRLKRPGSDAIDYATGTTSWQSSNGRDACRPGADPELFPGANGPCFLAWCGQAAAGWRECSSCACRSELLWCADAKRPNLLRLERWLLTEQAAFVPSREMCGHGELLMKRCLPCFYDCFRPNAAVWKTRHGLSFCCSSDAKHTGPRGCRRVREICWSSTKAVPRVVTETQSSYEHGWEAARYSCGAFPTNLPARSYTSPKPAGEPRAASGDAK
jgi:hypothetical protein